MIIWSAVRREVLNQHQHRADLIPNLVSVVRSYAAHEQAVLEAVTLTLSQTLFQALSVQLESTENRIAVPRGRYIKAIDHYNVTVRQFPTSCRGAGICRCTAAEWNIVEAQRQIQQVTLSAD